MAGYRRVRPRLYRATRTYASGDVSRCLVYDFIRDYRREHGHAPTQAEIADACFLSHYSVKYVLKSLERLGVVRLERNKWRGIRIVKPLPALMREAA